MASTNIQTFPGKVGVSNTNPIHTLDIGSNVYIDDTAQTKLRIIGNIHASGVTVDGTITAIDSENLSVKDPIILLASGSTGTGDTGIIMKRADGDSNVAVFYDEGVGLKIGHTLSTAQDIHISVDSSNSLSTSIYGPVTVAHSSAQALVVQGGAEIADDFKVGASKLFVDVSESNVGIGTDAPLATLDVHGTANVGALTVVSISGDGSALSSIQSSNVSDFASNVGRIATLETDLTSNVTRITNLESSDMTIGGEKTFSSNLTVGTANLFVDTTTSNVGIGTTNPGALLELSKATGSATISPTELRLTTTTDAADWSVTDPWARLAFYTDDVTGDAPGVMASVGAVASSVDGGENTRLAFFTAEPHLERMCVDRYGNVGIGTASPSVPLHASSSNFISDETGPAASANNVFRVSSTEVDSTLLIGASDTGSYISSFSKSSFATERNLILNANGGNVGIGTNSPSHKLNVRATSGDAEVHIQAQGNDGGDAILYFNGANADQRKCAIISSNVAPNSWCKQDLYFCHNTDSNSDDVTIADSKMVITNNGNVGIGTASPVGKFDVWDGASNGTNVQQNALMYLRNPANAATNYGAALIFENTNGAAGNRQKLGRIAALRENNAANYNSFLQFSPSLNGVESEGMRITSAGNVGIGTTGPESGLHIYGTDNPLAVQSQRSPYPKLSFDWSGSNAENFQFYDHHGSGRGFLYGRRYTTGTSANPYAGWHFYGNGNTLGVRIDGSGNVGIGTASPSTKLDVNGNIKHRGLTMSAGTDIDQVTYITKYPIITTTWTNTGLSYNDLATGVYFMQCYNYNSYAVGGGSYEETYCGVLAWFAGNTNSYEATETFVHHSGHAPNSEDLKFRTTRHGYSSGINLRLEVRSDQYNHSSASTLFLSFRRML